ncbi:MAG: PAS-domain containing protein [Alphaproteobacteria bacterium]
MLRLSGAWYWEATADLALTVLSDNLADEAGVAPLAWLGKDFDALAKPSSAEFPFAAGKAFRNVNFSYLDDSGRHRVACLTGEPRFDRRGVLCGWRGTGRDVTESWNKAQRAREAQELLLGAMESISEGFALYDADDRLILFNENYNFFHGRLVSPIQVGAEFEAIVRDAAQRGYYPAARGREEAWIRQRLRYHRAPKGVFEMELSDGRWLQIVERRTPSGGTVTINTDITAVKRRDEKQLQAQRLQALGQLTGGVAHDFSNALLLLECNLELVVQALREGTEPRAYLEGCETAIRLANGLTQRLLAVARQQPLQPKVVDVNQLILRMKELLGRTLPRAIEIETLLSPGLWRVLVDESQLEAALLNLSVNARDAMPNGGVLRLESANVYFEQGWADRQHDMPPGSYVVLTVTDSGVGMTRDVAMRALEPFFTTKEGGKSSGLGLSMIYGFIKQSGGEIEIDSTPGKGTSVRLLLPKVDLGDPLAF